MAIEFHVVTEISEVEPLREEWDALARLGGGGALFRGPAWLVPWWHAYHRCLGAELRLFVGREDGALVCIAPFYVRSTRLGPGLKLRELRLLGDAGPRPPALDILIRPGVEDRAGQALAQALIARADDWEALELEPLQDPSRIRAVVASRLASQGYVVSSRAAGGGVQRLALLAGGDADPGSTKTILASAYVDDRAALRKGMSALRRLSRLEWADRDENSPLADSEAGQLLEEVALELGEKGHARFARLNDSSGEAIAAALVLFDADRAVVVALAADPEHTGRGAVQRLLEAEARAAAERGCVALDVVTGADEHELPVRPTTRQSPIALRAYRRGARTRARTWRGVQRGVAVAKDVPGTAAAGARAAWTRIRSAASSVARYERLHLYRGELWTRGVVATAGLELALITAAEFDAMDELARVELLESLEVTEDECRTKWERGDISVLARLGGRTAGIAWCARTAVHVAELDRALALGPHEAYIHDVFVAPRARGRALAPSMLEFLAHELRQRDVYRAWALIGGDNAASIRAFEKAAYTAVADVVFARVAGATRMTVRPEDPEAKHLLGLS